MKKKYNFVVPPEHWEKAALGDDIYKALTTKNKEEFETDKKTIFLGMPPIILTPMSTWTVMDLGCGIGRIAKWVAPLVKEYIGIDASKNMINRGRKYNSNLPNVSFIHANSIQPFKNIDLIVCEKLFIHLPPIEQKIYIHDAYAALKAGGQILVEVPKAESYENGLTYEEILLTFGNFYAKVIVGDICYAIAALKRPDSSMSLE